MASRRPEHHRQNKIRRRNRHQQHPPVHIRVEDAVLDGHTAARQQSQRQHAPRQRTGDQKEQQRQPRQMLLSPEGDERHQNPCRQFCGEGRQKPQSRQKDRRGVGRAQQRRKQIPPPPEGDARKSGRHKEQHIVHGPVEHQHAIHIDHRHAIASPVCSFII